MYRQGSNDILQTYRQVNSAAACLRYYLHVKPHESVIEPPGDAVALVSVVTDGRLFAFAAAVVTHHILAYVPTSSQPVSI